MFKQSLVRASGLGRSVRYFRSNVALRDAKEISTPGTVSAPKSSDSAKPGDPEQVLGAKMHRCTDFDRWILVWMKKFPNKEAVPTKITLELLHKTQSQARIRTANLMMVATIIGCIWAVVTGKREAKAGRSLTKDNLDWHEKVNREYRESQNGSAISGQDLRAEINREFKEAQTKAT